jgi:RNA polymerase sigma-70 factor (ECF subfamily)
MPTPLVRQVVEAGCRAWPGVELDPGQVEVFLAQRPAPPGSAQPQHLADLYLACACLAGSEQAARHLRSLCCKELHLAFQRVRPTADEDDTLATLMAKLLVAQRGRAPKLSQYEGRADLQHWMRAVVVRHVLNTLESSPREKPLTEALLAEIESGSLVPEWKAMDLLARQAFKEALGKALEALPCRDRNLLRHRLDGLNATEIGALYDVSHMTALRWLSRAIATVKEAVLRELGDSLRLKGSDLESLVRSLLGRVDSSMRVAVSRALPGNSE